MIIYVGEFGLIFRCSKLEWTERENNVDMDNVFSYSLEIEYNVLGLVQIQSSNHMYENNSKTILDKGFISSFFFQGKSFTG